MNTKVKKPDNLERFELIAIIGLRDTPKNPEKLSDMTFHKSLLAVNEIDEKLQVYVNSKTQKGLNDFKKAYPNAEIRQSAALDEPEKWSILGFTKYISSEDETPLDVFYNAQHNEKASLILKERGKK